MSLPTSKNPNLTKLTKNFVDALAAQNGPPLYTLSPAEARQVLIEAQSGPINKPQVDMRDIDLPVGPTGKVAVRIIRPKGVRGKLPFILYIHGGGWVLGNKDTHDRLVRELSVCGEAAVVYVNYDPSPETKYPTPLEQIYAAFEHVVKNASDFDLNPDKVVISGDSVGGNMSIAICLMAKERRGPKISAQVLFYPVTDANFDTDSYQSFSEGPWLTLKAMQWFWDAYLPDKNKRSEITASPLRATTEQLSGLPPALIITAENDVLRDEGEAFARKLDAAGVDVSSVRCNGTTHDFVMLDALAQSGPTRAAMELAISRIRKTFFHDVK